MTFIKSQNLEMLIIVTTFIVDDKLLRNLLSQKTVCGIFWAFGLFVLNLRLHWRFPVIAFACSGLFGHTVLITFMCFLPHRFPVKALEY